MKREALLVLGINFLAILFVLWLHNVAALARWEHYALDFRFKLRDTRTPSPDIALITIDQKSVDEMGRFPWSRERHGQLVDLLTRAGARVIAFDVLFTEKDELNPRDDDYLGQSAARSGRTVFAMLFNQGVDGRPAEPLLPIPALQSDQAGVGFVNIFPETDGVTRKIPLWTEYNGAMVPSLALAAWAMAQHQPPEDLIQRLRPYVKKGPWNEAFINFTGWRGEADRSPSPFTYHSYVDVLRGRKDPALFKDKIVLVGGTLPALFDFKSVPNVHVFPGMEIQANALNNLIQNNFLRPAHTLWTIQIMVAAGLLLGYFMLTASWWAGAIASTGFIFGYYVLCQWVFSSGNLILNYATPTLAFVLVFIITLSYGLLTEEKERRRIQVTWGQYMPPNVIELLLRDPGRLRLGGEERDISVFFSDMVNFTNLSESLKPVDLVRALNTYLSAMTDIIFKYGGLLDKYVGDMIVAIWNAPIAQHGHPVSACLAALEQAAALGALRRTFEKNGWIPTDFRAGINTGPAIVGNMGSDRRFAYTAIGDTVNLASRLEGANKMFGTRLLISEATHAAARHEIEARELDWLKVKGKQQPIRVYELVARKNAIPPEKKRAFELFAEGLQYYRDRRFEMAMEKMTAALGPWPADTVAPVFIKRCETFIAHPPPRDWDGVYVMTEK